MNGEPSALDGVPLTKAAIDALAGGEMRGLLAGRTETVASLVAEVAEASGRVPMHVMEWSGGLRAVGGGMEAPPSAGTACDRAWQDGTDVARVASACAGMSILGYVREAKLLVDDIAGYREPAEGGAAQRGAAPDAARLLRCRGSRPEASSA